MTTMPRPPYERECLWCAQVIPEGQETDPCLSNEGDPHVLWMFDTTGLKQELEAA